MPPIPLSAIAQTPRKEPESKFEFNPVLAKVYKLNFLIFIIILFNIRATINNNNNNKRAILLIITEFTGITVLK